MTNTALLVLRITVGTTFLLHGLDKFGDLAGTEDLFASLAIPAPQLMAPLVAVTETAGGLLLIAGFATRWAALALAGDMLVAFVTAHAAHGFFVSDGGGELVLLLAGACVALALAGAGRYGVDAAVDLTTTWRRVSRRGAGASTPSRHPSPS